MKRFVLYVVLLSIALVFPVSGSAAEYGKMTPAKETALKWLDAHAELGKEVSLYVWHYPELGLGEHYSSAILQDFLKKAGFSVVDNVAGMKTAFVATWGQGKPVIGIHAEFDALPGISQVAGLAEEKQIVAGAPGHGCGHNVFGTYSVMAAIAVKEAIEKNGLAGTIKLYGTPAEETLVGKAYFVKDGIYKDDDIVISWHPGSSNGVSYASSLAMDNFKVRFYGKAAHASSAPWSGRSALDAVELMNIGMNYMREHVRPETRIHYSIPDGGKAPNVVPPYAEVWYFVRAPEYRLVTEAVNWAHKIAEGAAMMTGTKMEFIKITGVWQYLPNRILARVGQANVQLIGGVPHGEDHQKVAEPFARSMNVAEAPFIETGFSEFVDEPFKWATSGGSIDEANTSWVVPMVRFSGATIAKGTPGHSWQAVAQNALPPAFMGGLTAAKYMAATAIDLMSEKALVDDAQKEFNESLKQYGPFVDPVKDQNVPTFELMHNVKEDAVPRQYDVLPYKKPDLDTLMK